MTAATATFEAVLKAVDEASSQLRSITTHMKAVTEATHGVDRAVQRLDRPRIFTALTGNVKLLHTHFGELRARVGEVGSRMSELLPMLGVFGGLSSAVGLVELTEHAAETASQLANVAKSAGVTEQQFAALSLAAQLTDVSSDSMKTGMFRLNEVMAAAAGGQNKNALALFQHLHIALRDVHGGARSAGDVLPQLADAFEHTSSKSMQSLMAMTLFGRQGRDLLPMLLEGAKGLEEFRELSEQVNFVPEGVDKANLEEFHKQWILLTASVHGFTEEIGAKLSPILAPVLKQMREWLLNPENRKWVIEGLEETTKYLLKLFKEVDWKGVGGDIRWTFRSIRGAVDEIGGLGRAIELVIGYKVARWALDFVGGLVKITTAAKVARAALLTVQGAAVEAGSSAAFAPLLGRLATVAKVLGPIAAAIAVLWPTPTAGPDQDEAPKDMRPKGGGAALQRAIDAARHAAPAPRITLTPPAPAGSGVLPPAAISFELPASRPQPGLPNGLPGLGPTFGPQLPPGLHALPLLPLPPPVFGRLPEEASAAGPAPQGELRVKIDVNNLPPGSKVTSESAGSLPITSELDVGFSAPAFGF